jgi:hypothetical protein
MHGEATSERTSPVPERLQDGLLRLFGHCERDEILGKERENEVILKRVRSPETGSARYVD